MIGILSIDISGLKDEVKDFSNPELINNGVETQLFYRDHYIYIQPICLMMNKSLIIRIMRE